MLGRSRSVGWPWLLRLWLAKSVYEAAVTPLTYRVVNLLKQQKGLDVCDRDMRFNSLVISE